MANMREKVDQITRFVAQHEISCQVARPTYESRGYVLQLTCPVCQTQTRVPFERTELDRFWDLNTGEPTIEGARVFADSMRLAWRQLVQ
jgi:hypothetical protein